MKSRFAFILLILVLSMSVLLTSCAPMRPIHSGDHTTNSEGDKTVSNVPDDHVTDGVGTETDGTESDGTETDAPKTDGSESSGSKGTGSTGHVTDRDDPKTTDTQPDVIIPYPEPTVTPEGFGLVTESAAVSPSYFDDAAFIGDSISLKLKIYSLNGALGKANFFTVGSFSTVNALKPVSSSSTHPSYQGTKMLAEDCVAACGAKKVYIMLGMNDLVYGIDKTIERYKTLVARILAKSPDAEIFIQSMTPMRRDSRVWGSKLNNTNIRAYNAKLLETCKQMGWYYIDVQSIMWDDAQQQMRLDYCSDPGSGNMGMHMSTTGCKAWVDYLLTHTVDFSQKDLTSDPITEKEETP